jgi:GDPmannose 4,6-dehydratase
MSTFHIAPSFAKLKLPTVEEYQKRKVALISGKDLLSDINDTLTLVSGITGQDGSYL